MKTSAGRVAVAVEERDLKAILDAMDAPSSQAASDAGFERLMTALERRQKRQRWTQWLARVFGLLGAALSGAGVADLLTR